MSICLRRRDFIAGLGGAAVWPQQELVGLQPDIILTNSWPLRTTRLQRASYHDTSASRTSSASFCMVQLNTRSASAKGRSQFNVDRKVSLLALVLLAGAFMAVVPSVRSSLAAEPITPIPVPAQHDIRRVTLGEQLFHDPRLSHDNTRACGSCYDTGTNGASATAQDRGAHGLLLPFNTPTVFNAT